MSTLYLKGKTCFFPFFVLGFKAVGGALTGISGTGLDVLSIAFLANSLPLANDDFLGEGDILDE